MNIRYFEVSVNSFIIQKFDFLQNLATFYVFSITFFSILYILYNTIVAETSPPSLFDKSRREKPDLEQEVGGQAQHELTHDVGRSKERSNLQLQEKDLHRGKEMQVFHPQQPNLRTEKF